jgi:hypothetical protein
LLQDERYSFSSGGYHSSTPKSNQRAKRGRESAPKVECSRAKGDILFRENRPLPFELLGLEKLLQENKQKSGLFRLRNHHGPKSVVQSVAVGVAA